VEGAHFATSRNYPIYDRIRVMKDIGNRNSQHTEPMLPQDCVTRHVASRLIATIM